MNKENRTSFCEQKEAKKLFYAGAWVVSPPAPMAQSNKRFLVPFFQKRNCFT
jgi:hypothetical protein